MLGYISRTVNLSLLVVFIGLNLLEYMKKNNWILLSRKDLFRSEFIDSMIIVFAFLMISLVIQIYNKEFRTYLFSELLYNILPPLVAFFWINTTEKNERYTYFILLLVRNLIYFVFANIGSFTLANILAISWNDSKSSVFETPYAHDFFFLEIIFLTFGKEFIAVICMILCMLNFKRISFILSGIVMIAYILLKKNKKVKSILSNSFPLNKKICFIILFVLCLLPMCIEWLNSAKGQETIYELFQLNLNDFTTGRTGVMNYVVNNIGHFNGYGSSDYFMENSPNETYRLLGSMHCDILKIYLETTIVGVIVYFGKLIKIARKNWIVFLMLVYMIFELVFSHFIDVLSVWMLFFMFTAMIYAENGID